MTNQSGTYVLFDWQIKFDVSHVILDTFFKDQFRETIVKDQSLHIFFIEYFDYVMLSATSVVLTAPFDKLW